MDGTSKRPQDFNRASRGFSLSIDLQNSQKAMKSLGIFVRNFCSTDLMGSLGQFLNSGTKGPVIYYVSTSFINCNIFMNFLSIFFLLYVLKNFKLQHNDRNDFYKRQFLALEACSQSWKLNNLSN